MRVQRIQDLADLVQHRDQWDRLAGKNPFLSWDWLSLWWQHFGAEHELYVLLVWDGTRDSEIVAIAPWYLQSTLTRGRCVQFLGSGQVCSDYLRILVCDHQRLMACKAIAEWLSQANQSKPASHSRGQDSWDFLSFEGFVENEESLNQLRQELSRSGHTSTDSPAYACWVNPLGSNWEEFYQRLGSKQRRRKVRDVITKYIDAGRTDFRFAQTPQDFEEFYETFVQLHQMRRQSLDEPGCFASQPFASFMRDAAEQWNHKGQLLLSRLLIDGEAVSCSLGVVADGVHYIYQTGMNTQFSHHNPGWVMNVHNILHALDHGIQAIDYLRGDEPYKEKLGALPVPLSKFRIVANHTPARLRDAAWQICSELKQGLPLLSGKKTSTDCEVAVDGY